MHVFVVEPLEYAGRVVPVGVHEVTDAEAYGLSIAGRVRPATSTEIEEAGIGQPVAPVETEAAEVPQERESAAIHRKGRRK